MEFGTLVGLVRGCEIWGAGAKGVGLNEYGELR